MCGGDRASGHTSFVAELGSGVLLVRGVPATICDQCGEEWLDDATARRLEEIAGEARKKNPLVEVIPYRQAG